MEADILRVILLVIGAGVIFGMIVHDRYKRSHSSEHRRDWMEQLPEEKTEHLEPRWDSLYEPDAEQEEAVMQPKAVAEMDAEPLYGIDDEPYPLPEAEESIDAAPDSADKSIDSELEQLDKLVHAEQRDNRPAAPRSMFEQLMPKEQMSISFFTRDFRKLGTKKEEEEIEIDIPSKIIQLNIVPYEGVFYGDDVMSIAGEVGLEPGEMEIFHRFDDSAEQPHAMYSMASMVEPGNFPMDDMDNFSTPGLTLFSQLPGEKDGLSIFTDMLHAAEQMANKLEGELRDESHSILTKQTIEHMRAEIQEHHRQVQLARSKR